MLSNQPRRTSARLQAKRERLATTTASVSTPVAQTSTEAASAAAANTNPSTPDTTTQGPSTPPRKRRGRPPRAQSKCSAQPSSVTPPSSCHLASQTASISSKDTTTLATGPFLRSHTTQYPSADMDVDSRVPTCPSKKRKQYDACDEKTETNAAQEGRVTKKASTRSTPVKSSVPLYSSAMVHSGDREQGGYSQDKDTNEASPSTEVAEEDSSEADGVVPDATEDRDDGEVSLSTTVSELAVGDLKCMTASLDEKGKEKKDSHGPHKSDIQEDDTEFLEALDFAMEQVPRVNDSTDDNCFTAVEGSTSAAWGRPLTHLEMNAVKALAIIIHRTSQTCKARPMSRGGGIVLGKAKADSI